MTSSAFPGDRTAVIVDSSALLAILLNEDDAPAFAAALADAPRCRMSAANWLEAAMVADRRVDIRYRAGFDRLVAQAAIEIEPVTLAHATAARQACRDFGRGRHPAKLNFGDCLAYGLAKVTGETLLFKGDDFSQTDIEPALQA